MAKLMEKAVDSGDCGVENGSQELKENSKIFENTTGILNLEAKTGTRKILKIEFDLDQIEDPE
jgi:hypothetical protein